MRLLEGGWRRGAVAVVAAANLAACGGGAPKSAGETSVPASASVKEDPIAHDQKLKNELQTAKVGDTIALDRPTIGSITRLPVTDLYIATIKIKLPNEERDIAVLDRAKCVFDALNFEGKLGQADSLHWAPDTRIDEMNATVEIQYPPTPVLKPLQMEMNGITFPCNNPA